MGAQETEVRNAFIKQRFSRYYQETDICGPNRLLEREFGVITERGGMWRHLAFNDVKNMQGFLRKHVPLHAYHSSAYYEKPGARTMNDKVWKGADLVFDLDADHLPDAENMSTEEMLAKVKEEFIKLLDSYLLGDFGFDPGDILIVFSGGRGYHAHVRDRKVHQLNSHERREIVDFITRPQEEIDNLIVREIFDTKEFQGHVTTKYSYSLYSPDTPGWRGKVTKSVLEFISSTEDMGEDMVINQLTAFKGIGDKLAREIYRSLYMGDPGRRGIDRIRNDLNLEQFSKDKVRNSFINYIIKTMSVELGGETDEPVTSDIKRLIRLPGTLHGKSSLRVLTLETDSLRDFEPLNDAVWDGFDNGYIKVMPNQDSDIKLKGKEFTIIKGNEAELPEYAALHFVCQKKCNIII